MKKYIGIILSFILIMHTFGITSVEARYNSVVGVNTYQYTDPYTGSNILCTLNAAVCKVISND